MANRPESWPSKRPRVRLVLAASLDGFLAEDAGREDKEGLFELRAEADAVLVGARTVVEHDLALSLPKAFQVERRRVGRPAVPIRAVVSGRLGVRAARRLFEGDEPPWVFTTRRGEIPGARVVRLPSPLRMVRVLHELALHHARIVQAEGGARLAQALFDENVVDEWVLTITPQVLGKGIRMPFPRTIALRVVRTERLGRNARIWMERVR